MKKLSAKNGFLGLQPSREALTALTAATAIFWGGSIGHRVLAAESTLTSPQAPGVPDPVPSHVISPDDIVSVQRSVDQGPMFLALFGDSVSLATMADEKLGNPGPRFYADMIGSTALATVYEVVATRLNPHQTEADRHSALGKLFGNMARKYLSPYLGTQDYSLPILLKDETGYTPKIYNGAQMAGSYYFGQVYLDKFENFFARNPFHKKPEIIIVNFNGMDFLENRPAAVYATKIREFYQRLTKIAPYSKIVVTAPADPVALLTYPDRVSVPYSPAGPIKCSTLYKLVRFSNDTGLYPGAPQANIDAARARLAEIRGLLANEIRLVNHDQSVYPQFKGQATYVEPFSGEESSPEMIAADCIHPNKEAQKLIGLHMWEVISDLL